MLKKRGQLGERLPAETSPTLASGRVRLRGSGRTRTEIWSRMAAPRGLSKNGRSNQERDRPERCGGWHRPALPKATAGKRSAILSAVGRTGDGGHEWRRRMSERPPNGPSAKGGGKKSGGFWGFVNKVLSNVTVDVSIGGAPAPRAPRGNPTHPAARMEPVRQDRKETYEELILSQYERRARAGADGARGFRERAQVARSLDSRTGANGDGTTIHQSGGTPLPKDVRSRMEPRLGADLSQVKVHAGGDSSKAASELGAKAFTVGNDVHFGSGQLTPGTKEGDRLLAHELTHVVQGQKSGVQRKPEAGAEGDGGQAVSQPHEPAEQEADRVGDSVADSLHGAGDHGAGHDAHGKDAGYGTDTDGNAASEGKPKDAVAAGASGQKPAAISAKLESGAIAGSAGFDPAQAVLRKPASAAGATPTAGASPPAAAGRTRRRRDHR